MSDDWYIENGKMTGVWTVYNTGENVAMEVSYLNGELDGNCRGYHYEGELHCKFAYKKGKKDGYGNGSIRTAP